MNQHCSAHSIGSREVNLLALLPLNFILPHLNVSAMSATAAAHRRLSNLSHQLTVRGCSSGEQPSALASPISLCSNDRGSGGGDGECNNGSNSNDCSSHNSGGGGGGCIAASPLCRRGCSSPAGGSSCGVSGRGGNSPGKNGKLLSGQVAIITGGWVQGYQSAAVQSH